MTNVKYEIAIEDELLEESFYRHIVQLTIEDNDRSANTFSIRLSTTRSVDGTWPYPSEDKLQLFSKIRISASFSNIEPIHLIEGYVTGIEFHIDTEESKSYVEVNGMDPSVLMSMKEEIAAWIDKSDSQIAEEIFRKYSFDTVTTNTANPQKELATPTIQHGTDIEFLKNLAKRNGFECYVTKDYKTNRTVGYFRKLTLDETPQKDLSVHFGEENNIISFDAIVDGLLPLSVHLSQKDPLSKEVKEVEIDDSKLPKLGKHPLKDLVSSNISKAMVGNAIRPSMHITRQSISDIQMMEILANSIIDESSFFVHAKGVINAEAYGSILHAKGVVSIKGAGNFSGQYYVSRVVHNFRPESYLQSFEARKNALGLDK